jgi:hypothetical protein
VLPIDPDADPGRRAWLRCPACDYGTGCADCQSSRNCDMHWQYLLSNQATLIHLQCPNCAHLWATDTRSRHGDDPAAAA